MTWQDTRVTSHSVCTDVKLGQVAYMIAELSIMFDVNGDRWFESNG